MAVLRLVVDRRAALQDLLQRRRRRRSRRPWPPATPPPRASARPARRRPPCGRGPPSPPRRAAAACLPRARHGREARPDAVLVERAEHHDASAREERRVELEGRVLRRRADEGDVPSSITGRKLSCCARLKRWISSTKSSVPRPVMRRRAGGLEHLLEVGDAGEDRRDLLEVRGRSRRPGAARPSSCPCRADPRRSGCRASPRRCSRVSAPSGPTR